MSNLTPYELLHRQGFASQAWAERWQGDRFLNPNAMVCPVYNTNDIIGRTSTPDSLYTKAPGCNSSLDRVAVENSQRPQFLNGISTTLNPAGIQNDGNACNDGSRNIISLGFINNIQNSIPVQLSQPLYVPSKGLQPDMYAYASQNERDTQWLELGKQIYYYKSLSGCT